MLTQILKKNEKEQPQEYEDEEEFDDSYSMSQHGKEMLELEAFKKEFEDDVEKFKLELDEEKVSNHNDEEQDLRD